MGHDRENGEVVRYVWECLNDDCGRRETADSQADIKRCECGCAMMAIAVARDDETDGQT
jgi:hypothetical protein